MDDDTRSWVSDAAAHASPPTPDLEHVLRMGRERRRRRNMALFAGGFAAVAIGMFMWSNMSSPLFGERPERSVAGAETSRFGPIPRVAKGPRAVVANGHFDGSFGPKLRGRDWQLLSWHDEEAVCFQFVLNDQAAGRGCGFIGDISEALGQRVVVPSGDPSVWPSFTYGEVAPTVDAVEIHLHGRGEIIDASLHSPPSDGSQRRYYTAAVPPTRQATIKALGAEGQVLQAEPFCRVSCDGSHPPVDQEVVAAYEASQVPDEVKAAVFAVRAVAQAHLLDPLGDFWSYEAREPRGEDTWRIAFAATRCFRTEVLETCRDRASAYVDVVLADGTFTIQDFEGPADDEQARALLAFRQSPTDEPFHFEFPYVRLDPPDERSNDSWTVRTSALWTGLMPSPVSDYGSVCSVEALDSAERLVYGGRPFPQEVRDERFRAGGVLGSSVPKSIRDVASARIACDEPGPELTERLSQAAEEWDRE